MSIVLLPQEIANLQAMQAAGQYADAYRYLSSIAQAQGADPAVTMYLDRAASINANDGSWASVYVHDATASAMLINSN